MKRIAIMAAMGLLLAMGSNAQAQSGTSNDISAITGNFDQAQGLGGLQQSLSNVNDTQRDAIVQSLQSVINQLQSQSSQSSAASMPAGGYGAAANYGGYAAPVASTPAYSAPVYSAPVQIPTVAPVTLPPLPPIQLPPVQLPAINIPAPAPPAPAPQPQSFVEYGPVFNIPAPQPQTILVPVIVQQQPQRRHGCRLCNR